MKSFLTPRPTHSVWALVCALGLSYAPLALAKNELFTVQPLVSADAAQTPGAHPKHVKRSQTVRVNTATLAQLLAPAASGPSISADAEAIQFNLFADTTLPIHSLRQQTHSSGITSWQGRVHGDPGSAALLVINKGKLTGQINTGGKSYAIRAGQGQAHEIIEWDLATQEKQLSCGKNTASPAASSGTTSMPAISLDASASNSTETIDIAILYTNQVKAAGGDIAAEAQLAIDQTNLVFQSSGIAARANLVHVGHINHNESTHLQQEVWWLSNPDDGFMDQAPIIRQNVNADVMSLWTQGGVDYCGIANNILGDFTDGYNVLARGCATSSFIFAHELGHNMGARHDMEQDPTLTPFAYGHGATSPTNRWRTVMSYGTSCNGTCPVVPHFSSPLVSLYGEPLGDATYRDNARVLNETRGIVAQFSSDLAYRVQYNSIKVTTDTSGTILGTLSKTGYGLWQGTLNVSQAGTKTIWFNADGTYFGGSGGFSHALPNTGYTVNNGAPIYVVFPQAGNYDFRLNTTTKIYTVALPGDYYRTLDTLYLRGTHNNWGNLPMRLIAHYTWQTEATFGSASNQRFKLDVTGNWSTNYGDTDKDGIADLAGADILIPSAGTYRITYHDQARVYDIEKISGNQAPVANAGPDQSVTVGSIVTFNGSASTDSDGSIVQYAWTSNAWSGARSGPNPQFTFANTGAYTVTLTVTDNANATSTDTVIINVNPATSLQRTVVFMYGQTVVGQDMFLRGGIDWAYAKNNLGRDCAVDPWLCAIPMKHNGKFANETTRLNDKYLDWYGAELNQGSVQGSPLVWTTNNASNPNKVDAQGYGYTPLNTYGDHYWMLDVQMDCSKTVNGWFELKSYISNGPGWESNVSQPGAPYTSGNHFAQCGKVNAFKRGQSAPVDIKNF